MKISKVLWRLIIYKPGVYLTVTILWTIATLMNLIPGQLIKIFFDNLTEAGPTKLSIGGIILAMFFTAILHAGLLTIAWIADIRSRFNISYLLRRNLLSELFQRPGAEVIEGSPGEAVSTFRDDVDMLEDASDWVIDTFAQAILIPAVIFILIRIDPRIAAYTVIPLIVVVLVARFATENIKHYRRASRKTTEKVTGMLGEVLGSVQAIQIANAEHHVIDHVRKLNDKRQEMAIKDRLFRGILGSVFANSATLGTGLILIVAAGAMQNGNFSIGEFALFVVYLQSLTFFSALFGDFLSQVQVARVSFDRLVDLAAGIKQLDKEDENVMIMSEALLAHNPIYITGDLPPISFKRKTGEDRLEILKVEGLTYKYPAKENGDEQLSGNGIEDISFEIKRGELVVITGRVGSGKTTVLRTLLGLIQVKEGKIQWNEKEVLDRAKFFIPPRCAYTPQIPHLFSDTLKENILMGLPSKETSIKNAIHQAVFEQDVNEMAEGLETIVGSKGVRLSGGQVQRTAAARMFVRDPELLVFDDLSSALDIETEQKLWERLFSEDVEETKFNNPTCLVVSHRRPALRQANRIIVLKNGVINDQGTLDQLLDRCEEMQRIWKGFAE